MCNGQRRSVGTRKQEVIVDAPLALPLARIPPTLTAWKPDDEAAASVRAFAGGGDASAVRLHDGTDDGQNK